MDWGDTFSLHDVVTPQDAHQLGLMVAAMVNASLAKVVEDAVGVNIESFRAGLQEGLAQNGLDISVLLQAPMPLTDAVAEGQAQVVAKQVESGDYIVPVPWDTAH